MSEYRFNITTALPDGEVLNEWPMVTRYSLHKELDWAVTDAILNGVNEIGIRIEIVEVAP